MTKKTTLLIVFLFLVTCGLLYLALVTKPYKPTSTSPTPTPISVNAHTTLTLGPATASQSSLLAQSGQAKLAQYTLAVAVDAGGDLVNSVQLELAYDPQALTNVTVTPGSFFPQPNTLVNNVNTTDGRISYALAQQIDTPGRNGVGTVAFISFNVAPTYTNSTTTFTFLPKTAVAADKILESVLKSTTGYTLTITPALSPTMQTGTTSAQ